MTCTGAFIFKLKSSDCWDVIVTYESANKSESVRVGGREKTKSIHEIRRPLRTHLELLPTQIGQDNGRR